MIRKFGSSKQETGMRQQIVLLITVFFSHAALAVLPNGASAPDFTAKATLAGKPFQFSLAGALKKGPVVLYFYPAAFSSGCTLEAHEFAEATADFAALGATVIGVSHDDIDTLNKFSVSECRSKFAVAADPDGHIIKAYDAVLIFSRANRTSYVISPEGKVLYSYKSLDHSKHVQNTLAAVKHWNAYRQR
jgi:thioredoxin-dependent peroxiredoxin